jgi:glycosyltransferase involved in cell wall biosynthesis
VQARAFFLYRDSPLRRASLARAAGAVERYSLYGLDEIAARGFDVSHNLEPRFEAGLAARSAGWGLRRWTSLLGGYPGDFASVLACRRALNDADVVFSTVDTLGIPVTLLARRGVVRTPIVYAAIGLPERLDQLHSTRAERMYRDAYRRLHTIVAYGAGEVDALRDWLGEGGPEVAFVPFGVDTEHFRPDPSTVADVDVVSIGADPRRDYELLLAVARSRPEWSFLVVAPRDRAHVLGSAPANVRVEYDVPLERVRDRLRSARVVALPVRDNTYTGATTVLLQAMATGKPVVVSRTAAIADGYHLDDGSNALLVRPGDQRALESALEALLADEPRRDAMGARARETVEQHLAWSRYAGRIHELLSAACRTTVPA